MILIDMEMPSSCHACNMAQIDDMGDWNCWALCKEIYPEDGKRDPDCPLKEYPEQERI